MNPRSLIGYSQLSPSAKAIVELIPSMAKTPAQLEDELLYALIPEQFSSKLAVDKIATADAREKLQRWAGSLMRDLSVSFDALQERERGRAEELEVLKKDREAWTVRENELKRDLAAVQELRGTYESKRVNELEAVVARQNITNRELLDKLNAAELAGTQLRNEIEAKDVRADGYERSIQELATAAAAQAQTARDEREWTLQTIANARIHLIEARDLIEERWGPKPGPFIDAITAEITKALQLLPPINPAHETTRIVSR